MNKRNLITIILFTVFAFQMNFAQNKYDVNQFVRDGRNYYTNVKNWDGKDVIKLLAVGGTVYGLMQYDSLLNIQIKRPVWYGSYGIAVFGRMYGEPVTPLILSSALLIQGNSTGNAANKKLGFEIAQASFYSFTVVTMLKYIFGRERPATSLSPFDFHPFSFRSDAFLSLPSGHTTIAFSISTVLSENADTQFWKIASYIPAFVTATSRMYENRHWASDVVLGATLGYVTGKYFTKVHEDNENILPEEPTELFSFSIPLNLR